MKKWQKWLMAALLAFFVFEGSQPSASAAAAEASSPAFEPVNLGQLKDGQQLFSKIGKFTTDALEMYEEDAAAVTVESFYEVDLGNYPKGYTRQFIAFLFNYEWIELVLIATNEDASKITLLDRAATSEDGDMFINTAKLEFSIIGNQIDVWSQAPFSAFTSYVLLEWSGSRFYVVSHEYDDPTEAFYEEKQRLLKAKDMPGLIELYSDDYPMYPGAYDKHYTLASPTLKLAHQKALQMQKSSLKTAIEYLEFGLTQYADTFYGTSDYSKGKLTKTDIYNPDAAYADSQLSVSVYAGILNDYGYFLSLNGQNSKAKLVLANVIKLVPSRTVAYLNIADVEWALGQRTAAKSHYKQYWKLLGSKASSVAPKRVRERMNAK
jgi:hypothetical protein